MKRLLLLRHAKAVPSAAGDRNRPLAERGRLAAAALGPLLVARGWLPGRVLCSTALRTRQTLDGLLPAFAAAGHDPEIERSADLYEAMGEDYLDLIRAGGGEADCLMLVGHNSATATTAGLLAGEGEPHLRQAMAAGFPTAALAVLDFGIADWRDMRAGSGRLVDFVRPHKQ